MLEAFFNDEKTFSVFKYLLDKGDYASMSEVGVNLLIEPYPLHKILNNFDLLDMLKHDYANPLVVALDLDNPIVLSICILDELLEKYYMDDERERIKENGDFQRIIGNMDIENMSVLDFVECLKKIKN